MSYSLCLGKTNVTQFSPTTAISKCLQPSILGPPFVRLWYPQLLLQLVSFSTMTAASPNHSSCHNRASFTTKTGNCDYAIQWSYSLVLDNTRWKLANSKVLKLISCPINEPDKYNIHKSFIDISLLFEGKR